MAIKGKGKTKPRQPSRAPRRAPVPVKPPFFQRGWVKALAAFLAGILALGLVWWGWANLDRQRADEDRAADQSLQREAIASWQGNLEPALARVGELQGGGAPQIATNVGTAIDALRKQEDPGTTAEDVTALAAKLDKAAGDLEKFELSDTIANHGFDSSQTDVITTVQAEIAAALKGYAVAARLTARAIDDPANAQLVGPAEEAYDTAQGLLVRGWNSYSNIAAAAGVPLEPAPAIPAGG